jgi:LysR family hydrogen peroxide-inducible transcriptional activator
MSFRPHPVTLRQLQYVVAVADALSFRVAAETCHVSQPALSAQLAQLEAALGVRIFERDRRHVLMTASGREIVEQARQLIQSADDLVERAIRSSNPQAWTLRIGVIPTVAPYLLPTVAASLRGAYPEATTIWLEDKTPALVAALGAGTLDAALLALPALVGDVEREVIAEDTFLLAVRPDDPLGVVDAPAQATDLADARILLLEDGHCLRDQALSFCAGTGARELEFRATSLPTLAQMVAGGSGVTILPELAAASEAAHAGLRLRAFAPPVPHRVIALVWRRGSASAALLREIAAVARGAHSRLVDRARQGSGRSDLG